MAQGGRATREVLALAVVRNGDYWYYEWSVKGKKIRRSTGLKVTEVPREVALEREPAAKARVFEKELGIRLKPKVPTLLQARDRIYEELWHTYGDSEGPYQRVTFFVEKVTGDIPIDQVTSDHLMELKAILEDRGLTPSSINRYFSAITGMLKYARKTWRVIDQIPYAPRANESGNERIRVVDWAEEDRILRACDELGDQDFKDLYIVLVDTGMRRGEALALHYRKNIDFEGGFVTAYAEDTKTNRTRSIPMTKRVREVLSRRQQLSWPRPFAVFSNKYAPLRRLERVCEHAGLPTQGEDRIVIHSLRHTFASRLLRAGVPIYEVSQLLGHTTVTTTERFYAHLCVDTLRGSISVLDREVSALSRR